MSWIGFDGLDGYFCSPFVGEVEYACRDAAEGHALQAILLCQVKAGTVALCQLFFLFLGGNSIRDDRANGVDYMLGRQVVPSGYESLSGT